MTVRPLPRSRLDQLAPALLEAQALVALVPVTGDLRWAAAAAWDLARAAAQGGRRVALVDLWLEEPALHEIPGLTPEDGIVDAFEYGVSLTKTAHEVDHVFFIAAGSYTSHPGDLFAHERWRKLQAGFRSEGALLLLYCSAANLARLSAVPEAIIALAPEGLTLEAPAADGIRQTVARGAALLGVVRERWTPPPLTIPLEARREPSRRRARPGWTILAGLLLAATAGALWTLGANGHESPPAPPPARHPRPTATAPPATPHPDSAPPAARPPIVSVPRIAVPRGDSAAWTVQLAAYGALDKAVARAAQLSEDGVGTFVTPIATGTAGTVWYRVLAGAYASHAAAASARRDFWRRKLAPNGQGDLLRAPYSLALVRPAELDRALAAGIPAVRWGKSGAGARILVGAFETSEQAALADAQLTRAGVRTTLVTRTGRTTP